MEEKIRVDIMDIGNNKNILLYLGGFLLIMLILNACETTPYPIDYQLLDTNEKYRITVKRDVNSYEELISKGSVFRTDFVRFDNNRYFEMEMDLYTLQKYNTIKIHSLEFEFDGQKKIINVNRTIRFVDYSFRECIFIAEDHDDLNLIAYSALIECFISNIKIDLNKIFNKNDEDIGKDIYLILRVIYSFDKGEVVIQEDEYLVSVIKTSPVKTDLAYRLSFLKERFLRRRWYKSD